MLYLGVDSGGTKTAFVIADEEGHIIARHQGAAGNLLHRTWQEVWQVIAGGVAQVCGKAGLETKRLAYAGFGFPGYGESGTSAEELDALCLKALGHDRLVCANDGVIAWAGSLGLRPGINMIAGTGANCYGRAADGREARASGWGMLCDEGSGQWIGAQAIRAFTRQADGRMEKTALYHIIREHFHLREDILFCKVINQELAAHTSELAKLQLLVLQAYDQGDPHARAIYQSAAEELWLTIATTAKKLDFVDGDYRASYSGGVFHAGERILGPLRELAQGHGELCPPLFPPEIGAVLMAMEASGVKADFETMTFG